MHFAAGIGNENDLKIPACFRLTEPYPRIICASVLLYGPIQSSVTP